MIKNFRISLLVIICALVCLATGGAQADDSVNKGYAHITAVDNIARKALQDDFLAGLSIAVAKGTKILHARGYGYANLELNVPASPLTVYRIGSVTKQFTAASILQLMEAGKLKLDNDMRTYLPEFSTDGRVVTIHQLLNHTSGIKSITEIPEAMSPRCLDVSQDQVFHWISSRPFDFDPGENFHYNNSGIWLLGVILEKLSGQSYPDYIQGHIFSPANMKDSYYDSFSRVIPHRASGYVYENGVYANGEPNSPTRPYAAGALLSTVLDLVKWENALFSGKIINRDSLKLMTSSSKLNNGQPVPYGLGLNVGEFEGYRKIFHAGGQVGFTAFLAHYPEQDLTVAILTNTQLTPQAKMPLRQVEEAIAKTVLSAKTR